MDSLLPGTEVRARGPRPLPSRSVGPAARDRPGRGWEVILSQPLGGKTLYRLRRPRPRVRPPWRSRHADLRVRDGALRGREPDLLSPFEPIVPVVQGFQPERAGPLPNWPVYHAAFLLGQALGPHAHGGPARAAPAPAPEALREDFFEQASRGGGYVAPSSGRQTAKRATSPRIGPAPPSGPTGGSPHSAFGYPLPRNGDEGGERGFGIRRRCGQPSALPRASEPCRLPKGEDPLRPVRLGWWR